ncbi:MAG: ectonucleotide pyrophosphatase/phosphodiesterase [Pyrinomonadaceae bacterium]
MIRTRFAMLPLLFAALLSIPSFAASRRAVIVSLDGLDVRYLKDADKLGAKIPTLRRLMKEGVMAEGVKSVFPTLTYPNHTSLATATKPAAHGIFGNNIFEDPSGLITGAGYWFASDIRTDAIWDAASRSGMRVGLVSWPVGGGAGDYNVPEIWVARGSRKQSFQRMIDQSRPRGLYQEIEKAYPNILANYTNDEGDDSRTFMAEYIIEKRKPEVMFIHLYDLDHFEHSHGPFSPEALAMLEKADQYLARIIAAVRKSGFAKQTAVFVTSDHGFRPISKTFRPGVLFAQNGLATVPAGTNKVTDWKAAVYPTASTCAIYLKNPDDSESLQKALSVLKPLEGKEGTGIGRVIERDEIEKLGSNTDAALMIDAAEGYTCGGGYSGEYISSSVSRGTHGYLPDTPNFRASFIAHGKDVKRRGRIPEMDMTDVGATIASFLGLGLRDATGRAVDLTIR